MEYTKTIEVFEQIYNSRTLIYYGKSMVLGTNYGTMEKKLWYYRKDFDSVQKAMEL